MKKSLLLIPIVFLLLGIFPKVSHAENFCSDTPGGNNIFCPTSAEQNSAINHCNVTKCRGGVCEIGRVFQSIGLGQSYDQSLQQICDASGNTNPYAVSQQEIYAIFNSPNNSNQSGGILGMALRANDLLVNQRPASGVDFIQDKVYAITNPGKVYAADSPRTYYPGAGAELLKPIQGFWGWSVNVVFGFLILLIIVIALGIMFRQRLGGAAEITLQSAIPSIALAMILIPLSYAISGLFIDAVTLGTNAVHGFLLGPQSPGAGVYANRPNAGQPECDLESTDVTSGGVTCDRGYYADDPLIDVWRARDRIDVRQTGAVVGAGIVNLASQVPILNLISGLIQILSGSTDDVANYAWFGNVVNVIIGILTIWIAIQIFVKLIGKYVNFILMPAISPFLFATIALPGTGTKVVIQYLKIMGASSLFYITTYAMFLLTLIFTDPAFQSTIPDIRTSGYIPPLLGIQGILKNFTSAAGSFPLTQLILTLVGIGIYFSIPSVLDSIDVALGTKFVIPEIIKTPFKSMAESLNVATRAGQVTFRRAAELNQTRRTAVPTAQRNIRNLIDQRIRGLQPGEAGTWQNTESKKLAERKQIAQRARQAAIQRGDNAGVRAANKELAAIENESKIRGIPVGYAEDAKKPDLKVTFKWQNGISADNMISFNNGAIDALYGALASGRDEYIYAGKLIFEASNFILPNSPIIQVSDAKQVSPTEYEFGTDLGLTFDPGVKTFGDAKGKAGVPLSGFVELIVGGKDPGHPTDPQDINPDTEGKKIEVGMWLKFSPAASTLFGTKTGDSYTGGSIDSNNPGLFTRRVFKIGQYESNAVRPTFTYTGT